MGGPEKRGGRGAGGSGEAQAQGQPRDSAMAPMQPSLGPPRDEPRVFGLDKFNDDNFAEWSFKMENIFDHFDMLEVMEGTEKSDYEECAFAFFSPVEMPGEPATLKEALESSDAEEWKKAMESERKSIEENGTWELVELPEGRKAITSKWLFKIKSDADGKIERYKYRLVSKGYQQKEKVEYKELFAPVVKLTTLRTLIAGAAIKGWVVKQMDVTTAFLNGVLEEEIFMAQPEGMPSCHRGPSARTFLYCVCTLTEVVSSPPTSCETFIVGRAFSSRSLPSSPQQNGIAERRIGLVMEVSRTSMIHAAAPHFLWPVAVRYTAHQLNLWPRVSLPETSPTLRWTGEVDPQVDPLPGPVPVEVAVDSGAA
ncbi:unnamed protein product [Closterium sp. NIES-54]